MKAAMSLTDNGSRNFTHAMIAVKGLSDAADVDDVVVVARGEGVELLDPGTDHLDDLEELLDDGVTFKASESCVESRDLELIDGVDGISSGAVEIARLQSNGYNLIKVP